MKHNYWRAGPPRFALSTIAIAFVFGCTSAPNAPAGGAPSAGGASTASKADYMVSVSTGISGPNNVTGVPVANGFQAYMANLNDSGGVNGHHINVQVLDDKGDVPTGLANYQQILSSSSLGNFLTNGSAVVEAEGAKATVDGIPYSNVPGYNGGVTTVPFVYNINPSAPIYFDVIADWAASKYSKIVDRKGAKVAFFSYDSALSETIQTGLTAALTGKGYTIAYSELVPRTAVDFSVAATAIAAAQPAILVESTLDAQIVTFITQVRQHGYPGPILHFSTPIADSSLKTLNDNQLYIVQNTIDPLDTSEPDVQTVHKVAEKYGLTQGLDNINYIEGWVFAQVAAAAIEKCGDTCTRSSLNTALENTTVDAGHLMPGHPGFSPTNHVMGQKTIIALWDDAAGYTKVVDGFGF